MKFTLITEFKPALTFLVKFVVIYLVGNVLYGLFVTYYYPEADPVTQLVTDQSSGLLQLFGFDTEVVRNASKPHVALVLDGRAIISVYEGCNGLNVMIIFAAFLAAFGPVAKRTFYFWLAGTLAIHAFNLIRVIVLFWIAWEYPSRFYFLHKYFFTASLYMVVFILWYLWLVPLRMEFKKQDG